MTEHPRALTLSLLLLAELMQNARNQMSVQPVAQHVVDNYLGEWSDEKRAELVTRLADGALTSGVRYNDTHGMMRRKVNIALRDTEDFYP